MSGAASFKGQDRTLTWQLPSGHEMDPQARMATHGYCNVGLKFKQTILALCFSSILFEWNAGQLFLWPVEHSCARSANLSSYSSLLLDLRNHSINPDVVQRNLIVATPEDPFTLARASAMGIDYDDIARCFEYPVDYGDNRTRETFINMESLEICRFGVHFESDDPNLSIIEHFNLTCARQGLKNLLPQAFAFGLFLGSLACHYELQRKQASGARVLSRSSLLLTSIWLIVFVATKRLDNIERNSRRMDTHQGNSDLAKLVLCILLRSIALSTTLCRVLRTWSPLIDDGPDHVDPSFKESHKYLKMFSLMLILAKMLFMPLALRLMHNWSTLNRFLTFNMTLVVSLSLVVELAHSPDQMASLRLYLRGKRASRKLAPSSRWQPVDFGHNSDEEVVDAEELDSSMSTRRQANFSNSLSGFRQSVLMHPASSRRVCEFCSLNEQKIYTPAANSGSAGGAPEFLTIETAMSTTDELFNPPGSTYAPTTMTLGVAASGFADVRDMLPTKAGGIAGVRHNVSLVELELFKSPLRMKLLQLTFCVAFNYFLMQTMPNHKLLHSEPIASLMARKSNHIHGQLPARGGAGDAPSAPHYENISFILLAGNQNLSSGSTDGHDITLTSNTTLDYLPLASDSVLPKSIEFVSNDKSLHNETKSSTYGRALVANSTVGSRKAATEESKHPLMNGAGRNVTHPLAHSDQSMQSVKEAQSRGPAVSVASATPPITPPPNQATPNKTTHGLIHTSEHNVTVQPQGIDNERASTRTSHEATVQAPFKNETGAKTSNNTMVKNRSIEVEARLASAGRDDDSSGSLSPDASPYRALFDFRSHNFASRTLSALRDSNNPLEILWLTVSLNGWPIELAVVLLHSPSLTNFESNNFKLNRLFVLAKHCTMLLVLEWLLVALIRAKNHLIELEWLLLVILTLARFLTSLLLYGHLHMLFRLAHKLQSNELFKIECALPVVLGALVLALMAPIAERIDLIIIPSSILLTNLLARYLASKVDTQLRGLLCPMMFENDE